jgi:hypothetical protein
MILKLQFVPNQQHQLDAIEAVVRVFEGLPKGAKVTMHQAEGISNLPPYESLSEAWLFDNLHLIQQENNIRMDLLGNLAAKISWIWALMSGRGQECSCVDRIIAITYLIQSLASPFYANVPTASALRIASLLHWSIVKVP